MSNSVHRIREKAYKRQAGRCFYCDCPMWLCNAAAYAKNLDLTLAQVARLQCTTEHLTPKSDGGGNSKGNIVAACRFCNQTRHRRKVIPSPEDYRASIQRRMIKRRWHQSWVFVLGLYANPSEVGTKHRIRI